MRVHTAESAQQDPFITSSEMHPFKQNLWGQSYKFIDHITGNTKYRLKKKSINNFIEEKKLKSLRTSFNTRSSI